MIPEIKIGYLSPWHHLIFVEELVDDDRDKTTCKVCWEQVVGTVYKCLECDFIQHKSCPKQPLSFHYWKHHLMLVEEVENRAEEEVVCSVCQEPPSLLTYKWTFLLHKSCAELSYAVLHPQNSNHVLPLQAINLTMDSRGKDKRCNACNKLIKYLYYGCRRCNVYLHPKCFALETELEPQPESKDRSPWHHLIFVEELADKNECQLCEVQAVGTVDKCLELGCVFITHKSCPKTTERDWKKRVEEVHHRWKDHLMLVEEVENRDEEAVVCWGCEAPHLFWHTNAPSLDAPLSYIDLALSADDFHEHTVVVALRVDPFTCQACGEECKDLVYICNICRLIMERDCADFPHSIRTTLHGPSLIFIHSVRLINKEHRALCRFWRKQVSTRYEAYNCIKKCGYILHLKCARRFEDKDSTTESESRSCEEHTIYLLDWLGAAEDERVDELEKFKHFDHPQHELTLSDEEPGYDKKYKACKHFLFFAPYYGCMKCNFLLHVRCAKLPTNIRRGLLHKHLLTFTALLLWCHVCEEDRGGYGYRCDKCDKFEVDVKCGLLPESLEHVLHEHTLFLVRKSESSDEQCNVCGGKGVCYVCTDCEFRLCGRCVAFPATVRYRYHPHT